MKNKFTSFLLIGGVFFLLIFFSYKAITSVPFEFDSIIYHVPLAKSILNGQIFHPDKLHFPNSAFPASSELILALMMLLHVPLNLFNIIAWVILGFLLYFLGKRFGLKSDSRIFSFSIITLPTVMRLLLCQTTDIWLAVFFVWILYLFQKPEKKLLYFFQLGLSSGFLIGSKFSGPLFLLALLLIYGKKVLPYLSLSRFICFFIPFFLFGLSWYVRNAIFFSNPFYPAPFLWMKGIPAFFSHVLPSHFNMIMTVKNGLLFTTNAIVSEYLFWPFLIIFGILFVTNSNKEKIIFKESRKLLILGVFGVFVYLAIPGYAYNYNNYVSEIRYSIPVIISLLLLFFVQMQKLKISKYLFIFIFLNFLALITLFFYGAYHPKIIVLIGLIIYIIMSIPYPKRASQ